MIPLFEKLAGRTPGCMDQDAYKKFAILAPFLPDTGEFLFQVRSQTLTRQPGEICFPGGHIEAGETPLAAAIRETTEELLIPEDRITVLAPLDILISPYRTVLFPYLASLSDYTGSFNRAEVQEVFTVPFEYFLNTEPQVTYNQVTTAPEDPSVSYRLLGMDSYRWAKARYPVLFYPYGDKLIWGLTARIIDHIVRLHTRSASAGEAGAPSP